MNNYYLLQDGTLIKTDDFDLVVETEDLSIEADVAMMMYPHAVSSDAVFLRKIIRGWALQLIQDEISYTFDRDEILEKLKFELDNLIYQMPNRLETAQIVEIVYDDGTVLDNSDDVYSVSDAIFDIIEDIQKMLKRFIKQTACKVELDDSGKLTIKLSSFGHDWTDSIKRALHDETVTAAKNITCMRDYKTISYKTVKFCKQLDGTPCINIPMNMFQGLIARKYDNSSFIDTLLQDGGSELGITKFNWVASTYPADRYDQLIMKCEAAELEKFYS